MKRQSFNQPFVALGFVAMMALPKIKVLPTDAASVGAQITQADAGCECGTFSVNGLIKAAPRMTSNAVVLAKRFIAAIEPNRDRCRDFIQNSIGLGVVSPVGVNRHDRL